MEQRAARIGGLPFLTVWQFMGVMGMYGFAAAIGMPTLLSIIIAVMVYVALIVYRGEFLCLRLWAVLKVAVLMRVGKPSVINLSAEWEVLKERKQSSAAIIYRTAAGGGVVSSVSSVEEIES